MSLKHNIELKNSINMTQDLKASIEVLSLSTNELIEYMNNQMVSNPLLEFPENGVGLLENSILKNADKFSSNQKKNYDYDNIKNNDNNLKLHVYEQIIIDIKDQLERNIALYLLDIMDDNGYINIDNIFLSNKYNCSEEIIQKVLLKLQQMDPPGIFARNLSECISIQLKEKGYKDEKLFALIDNLELVANLDFNTLKKKINLSEEIIKDYIALIRSTDPKPGSKYNMEMAIVIEPDFIIKKSDNDWLIEENEKILPKLDINQNYYSYLKNYSDNKLDKNFISELFKKANWLVKTISFRNMTLLKIMHAIFIKQEKFFEKGVFYLLPMSLQDIADETYLSISTISRLVNKKYVQTPFGTFELKYFFSNSVVNDRGNNNSVKKIKYLINKIIQNENIEKIYTDCEITEILEKYNIQISRRTVAKYREQINIPSSAIRKKNKKIVEIC